MNVPSEPRAPKRSSDALPSNASTLSSASPANGDSSRSSPESWGSLVRKSIERWADLLLLVIATLVLISIFRFYKPTYLNPAQLSALAIDLPYRAILVVAMTLLLVVGGIDLSIGSVMALSSVVIGWSLRHDVSPSLAIVAGVATGALCGAINGGLSVGLRIPSFIATLGMLEFARGAAAWLASSKMLYLHGKVDFVAKPMLGIGIAPSFLIALGVVIAGHRLLTRSTWGRSLVAIGTNEPAARLAGLQTTWPPFAVFVLMGLLAGMAGWFQTALMGSADPNSAIGMELTVIAAVVIGGTSLMGGRGSVIASLLGLLLMTVLESGLSTLGVDDPIKRMTQGAVIVLAVTADALRRALSGRR